MGSVGRLTLDLKERKAEVIEADHGTSYVRILVSGNGVRGAQFVGRTEEAGLLFSLIRSGYPYEDLCEGLSRFPWYYRLNRYLGPSPRVANRGLVNEGLADEAKPPHRICTNCGYYRGRVITSTAS